MSMQMVCRFNEAKENKCVNTQCSAYDDLIKHNLFIFYFVYKMCIDDKISTNDAENL